MRRNCPLSPLLRAWRAAHVRRWTWSHVVMALLLTTMLGVEAIMNLMVPLPVYANTYGNPNPSMGLPAWLQPSTASSPLDLRMFQDPVPFSPIERPKQVSMTPLTLTLTTQAQDVKSDDHHLEMMIPAGTVTDEQIEAAGGKIQLKVEQLNAGAGSSTSGQVFLGTYQLSLSNAAGAPLTDLVLQHPLQLSYTLLPEQYALVPDAAAFTVTWNNDAAAPVVSTNAKSTNTNTATTQSTSQKAKHLSKALKAKKKVSGLSFQVSTSLSVEEPSTATTTTKNPQSSWVSPATVTPTVTATPTSTPGAVTPTATPPVAPTATATAPTTPTATATPKPTQTPSSSPTVNPEVAAASTSTITFSTNAPQATWGTPTDFQVGLNAGGLNYTYPIEVPDGSGDLTPTVNLSYSSGSVNESHNVQAAAPWLGQGWNFSMGSISWSTRNVTPGGTNRIENVWNINDPSGISGQLIPPDLKTSTTVNPAPYPAMSSLPAQYIWHTAPESHAKIQEVNFNGAPCWHVWLPNGLMEEFGCTDDSRQGVRISSGVWNTYRWDLNLIVDRYGNQIRINYQRNMPTGVIRDAVISSIEYDDPTCHNTRFNGATAQCSTWNPKVRMVFAASGKVERLTNSSTCSSWSKTDFRCDDPVDLSGSGGLGIAKAINTYVLNAIEVQVQGHVLHKYLFSYEQSPPQQITDPVTGLKQSVSGYLDLTKIEEQGTDGASLNAPVITMSYQGQTQHYLDGAWKANSANCGPSIFPSGCYLWSQSYNARYLQTYDNGRGWHETITWKEAHPNIHGVSTGAVNDVFACTGNQASSNLCTWADDENWSRIVVQKRAAVSNGVTSTWSYQYYLRTGLPDPPCSGCTQGWSWGNQNDNDYADYYNGIFTSFASARVTNPDNSYQIHSYASTNGWGVATSSMTCYLSSCNVSPYADPDPGMAGREKQEQDYGADGKLLKVHLWTYTMNCPPGGVPHSTGAAGAPYDIGDTQLSSQLDLNNPVIVCDPRVTQEDVYQVNGVTDASHYQSDGRVVHTQTNYSYDGGNAGSNRFAGYDYGNINKVDVTANNINGAHVITSTTYYPNDQIGSNIYLPGLAAVTQTLDASGNILACSQSVYGSNTTAAAPPTVDGITQELNAINSGGCGGQNVVVKHLYDASGTLIGNLDANGNTGCTIGTTDYTDCATYDSFGTHLVTAQNALGHSTTSTYDATTAAGGYGQWVLSTTDVNGQTTSYQYDALGRLTAVIRPLDSASSPSTTYTYINSCTNGSTTPCLEIDTTTRVSVGGPTTTTRQWYDGWGNLVETRKPGPNGSDIITYTVYDKMNRATIMSLPYSVPTGANYVAPDLTKARTVTNYDGLGRSLGAVTYSDATTIAQSTSISYTVGQGMSGLDTDQTTPFEQTITFDAYKHQSVVYTDALGRKRYEQVFSGTTTPYSVVRTVAYAYDLLGNLLSTQTMDSSGTVQASYAATYDALKRRLGLNDSDSGSCSVTPLPAGCSSATDTAWKFTYDDNGNLLSQRDPRGQSVYMSYDGLNRLLCKGSTSAAVNPCTNDASETYFYDGYNNGSNWGVTFPAECAAPTNGSSSYPLEMLTAETFKNSVGNGWRCYSYDERGRKDMSALSVTADGQTTIQNMYMAYNDLDQVTTLTYPDGEKVTSTYNTDGYFQSAYFGESSSTDPVDFLVGKTSYTDGGLLAGMGLGGSGNKAATPTSVFSLAFGYDGIQRVTSSTAIRGGTTFWSQTRTLDNVGNVLQVNTTVPKTDGSTDTDTQSFCYDALNRLVWAGNSGTPTGGDHCGNTPTGSTTTSYHQLYSYDSLDRLTNGPSGTMTYDSTHPHAVKTLSTVPNQYASYDAMGNMICRTVDTTGSQSCADGTQTGAIMSYDEEGQLVHWQSPAGKTDTDDFLYDTDGNRVLQRSSVVKSGTTTVTDTIYFDGYTEVAISGGTTAVTKYYTANGRKVAMNIGNALHYLISDLLGSVSTTLKSDGSLEASQLFSPFGSIRHRQGTMPTAYNFTGQRLDELTGLLYYGFRYYDPVSGRFVRTDTLETNAEGLDTYAYVYGNPETLTDPTGHWGWGAAAMVVGSIGAAVGIAAGLAVLAGATAAAAPVLAAVGLAIGAAYIVGLATMPTYSVNGKISDQAFDAWGQQTLQNEAWDGLGALIGSGAGLMAPGLYRLATGGVVTKAMEVFANISALLGGIAGAGYSMLKNTWGGYQQGPQNVSPAATPTATPTSKSNGRPNTVQPPPLKKAAPAKSLPSNYSHIYTNSWYNIVESSWRRSGSSMSSTQWHAQANWNYIKQLNLARQERLFGW